MGKSIFLFGVKDEMTSFKRKSVILSNQISIIFSVILLLITALQIFVAKAYIPAAIIGGLTVFLLIIPFLNKAGFIRFSGFIVSLIIPFVIVGASTVAKFNFDKEVDLIYYIAPRILLIGTLVIPLVLIDYRDKLFFYAALVFNLVLIAGYSEIQKTFGVGIEKSVYVPDTYIVTSAISVLSFFTLVTGFVFFQKINIIQEEELKNHNEELRQQSEEMLLVQQETEKMNVELLTERLKSEENNLKLKEQAEELKKLNQKIFAQSLEADQNKMEVERAYQNLEILGAIGKRIISMLTVEEIIDSSYKNLSKLINFSVFAVGIYNEKNDKIEFPGTYANNKKIPPYSYPSSKQNSFSVYCFKNRAEIFINDLEKEYGKYLEDYPELEDFNSQSFIYCPLFRGEKTIGTVAIHHNTKNAFTEKNLFIMQNIATYISLALQNAESYRQIKTQMQEIRDKNIMVNSSLNYAKTIQESMLPSEHTLREEYNTELVFFPRDIVSGDFYWTANIFNRRKFIAAVDCTGHGVPGAFLSFVGSKSLDEIVHSKQIFEPKNILNALDENIKNILNQENSNNRDGMDVSMCAVEKTKDGKVKVLFSGAKLPLYYYRKKDKTVQYIKGSRKSIGGGYFDEQEFEQHELLLDEGDVLYIATDGYIDQDSPKHKRFGKQRFISMIENIAEFPVQKQRAFVKQIFTKFKEENFQRDDVTVLITQL